MFRFYISNINIGLETGCFLLFYSCVMKDVDACFCLVIKKVNATFFQNSDVFSCNSELHLTVQTFYLADVNLHLQGKKSKL